MRSVTQRLDEEAQEELAILALAERMDDAPGTERIEAFREPHFDELVVDREAAWGQALELAGVLGAHRVDLDDKQEKEEKKDGEGDKPAE